LQRRFEILSHEVGGGLPELVRSPDGGVLRLSHAPTGILLGSFAGTPVYGSVLNAWEEERTAGIGRAPGTPSAWLELDDAGPGSGWLDEVRVRLGPERGGGLFERTATDAGASVETTATAGRVLRPEFSRMAVLARVAAWQDPYEGTPVHADSARDDALDAIRRVILSEPLDPLPVLSDVARAKRDVPVPVSEARVHPRTSRVSAGVPWAWWTGVTMLVGLAAILARC
jgi:hypothetical protein